MNKGTKEIREFKNEMRGYYKQFLEGDNDAFDDWFNTLYRYLKEDRLIYRKDDKTLLRRA